MAGTTSAFATLRACPPGRRPVEFDRLRRRVLWRMPSGLYLLGSAAGGRRNLMTHTWAMQVPSSPSCWPYRPCEP